MCKLELIGLVIFAVVTFIFCAPVEENVKFGKNSNELYAKDAKSNCDCVCGLSNRQMRVVGGNISKPHEFPWLAGLSKNGEFYCGATVITTRHLLTAAHCVDGINQHTIVATLGDHDHNSKDRLSNIQVRKIKNIIAHKLFDISSYNNDIAILELNESIDFDAKIQPACLPTTELVDYTNKLAVVAGWGKTGENNPTSNILRKVTVPIWSKQDCYNSGYGENRLSENMFCAGFELGKRDACQGDSGGPLQIKDKNGIMEVIGVVSWGRGCARPNLPGIYTKIVNYLDWIQNSLNGECLCSPPIQNPRRA